MSKLDELTSDFQRADALVGGLVSYSTGGAFNEGEYMELRRYFIDNSDLAPLLPDWFPSKRSLHQFWEFIKHHESTYAGRREYLWNEFERLLQHCESQGASPSKDDIEDGLKTLNSDKVGQIWRKMIYRLPEDPEGAITASRTLVEAVCKHILDDCGIQYDAKNTDLPSLYKLVSKELNLAPEQHQEQVFKQILGGCSSVVNGLGSVRNSLGDAHGQGRNQVRPSKRHARLAANLSGTMALYLIETYQAKAGS